MAEFASKGVAGAGLGLGIAGTALGLLQNGGLGGILTGGAGNMIASAIPAAITALNSEDQHITRREFEQSLNYEREIETKNNKILELTADNAIKDSNMYTDRKIVDTYTVLDKRLNELEKEMKNDSKAQAVMNQSFSDGISVLTNQLTNVSNTVANITKTVVPNTAICPGWGQVNVSPANACQCGGSLYN